ncbi:MAG: DUF5597 domain-containing protein [Ignavibacteriae bacterium]|nr:DUF5597 domain-containing protein [Ignavibacteriota bacterium]
MKNLTKLKFLIFLLSVIFIQCETKENGYTKNIPHLDKKEGAIQLIVDDKPFLILGGELGNSSFTSLEYMKPIWQKLKLMNLNTILVPIYWELIEPTEGKFDFDLFDELLSESRKNNFKLIILWFGSWKNSMSSHAPAWVKTNQERFPRVKDDKGKSQEILTPFSNENLNADIKAFQALMKHIKEIDENENTVIMIQPENEIGMLGSARDYHPLANEKFNENVPSELMQYLIKNKNKLVSEFLKVWEENGLNETGTWEAIFGKSIYTDEIFMSYYFAKYTEAVTKAGKEIYPLPMFVNAALNAPNKFPGEYPSAGPLPHLMDIWKFATPSIDFLSPDFYNPNFKHWCDLFTRQGNPLFIPEHRFDNTVAAKSIYAFGHYEAIGFSPFSIESTNNAENEPIGKIYDLINQLTPIITEYHGKEKIDGVILDKTNIENKLIFGKYEFTIKHSYTLGYEPNSKNDDWEMSGALIIQTNDNEFFIAGFGFVITFKNLENPESYVGILKTEEGKFENNKWKVIRHLNGDQTHQGRHIRAFVEDCSIQRFELYDYK